MSIRPLEAAHLPAILEIALGSFPVVWAPKEFTYFISHPFGICVGLFHGEELYSYFMGLLVKGEMDIVSIATLPVQRGNGFAEVLLRYVCDLPEVERAFLEVAVNNDAAIRLYKKVGFEAQGIRKKYYQQKHDACLMRWLKHG